MQLVQYAQTEIKSRGINHRAGSFRYKDLGAGVPGTPGNYFLRLVWSENDFFSPRHLHNFDQVRVQVQGEFDFATDGKMKPGTIAYFPEGTAYGPQTSQEDTIQLVMQIGGPSGCGYISEAQRVAAVEALAAQGEFREGRYFAAGDTSTSGVDSFQAAWEFAQGQEMVYPKRRFQKPVMLQPEALVWLPVAGANGVDQRHIWHFGPNTVGVDMYQLAAGARYSFAGPASCFVDSGSGGVDAAGTASTYGFRDAMNVAAGESFTLTAHEPTRLTVFVHPVFDLTANP